MQHPWDEPDPSHDAGRYPRTRTIRTDRRPGPVFFKVPKTDFTFNGYRMAIINPLTMDINPMECLVPGLDDCVDLISLILSLSSD